ncbi:Flp family type IVb pilin [Variovorax paradoxus]|uniref:Flp family type IVb pilin n=1 Tax=Variovorax paradoxus TaxID=34073 RepID=UPI0029C97E2C|nr:Flp family type IVb pilin [Variovorax paradoxus]
MLRSITRFLRDEEGATAIEYGIIAGLMAIVLAAIFSDANGTLAAALRGVFSRISTTLGGAAVAAGG